jgi:hypothetical protein
MFDEMSTQSSRAGAEMVVTYELRAILKNNKHITLFEFKSPEELLYTKQQIEAWLRMNGYVLEASPRINYCEPDKFEFPEPTTS